jgi:membrane-associated protein
MSNAITELFLSVSMWAQLGLLGLFSYTEGLPIIGSVLPGGTIAILAGTLSVEGVLSPWAAALVVGIASFAGDMTGFFVGKKITHWKIVQSLTTDAKYKRSWDLFDRHLALITIFGKLLPVVRSTPSLFAALRNVRTRRYLTYSLIGSLLWGFAGVFAGNVLGKIIGSNAILIVLGLFVGSILVVGVRHLIRVYRRRRTS